MCDATNSMTCVFCIDWIIISSRANVLVRMNTLILYMNYGIHPQGNRKVKINVYDLFSLMKLRRRNLESRGKSNAVSLRRAFLNLSDLQVDFRVYCLINARKVKTLTADVYELQ